MALLLLPWLLAGCATTEGRRLDQKARERGLRVMAVEGGAFQLRAYQQAGTEPGDRRLHIYFEGDGRPWIDGRHIAVDPHGRNNLAFELLLQDPVPSIYVERPCYQRLRAGDPCNPDLWTHGRYSEAVVSSLAAAVQSLVAERRLSSLVLIGYSGGGVLASLVAARVEGVQALITIASNLDVQRWADYHGYEPLLGSLNPAGEPPLPVEIRQVHWLGGQDLNVPSQFVEPAIRRQTGAEMKVIEDFDHVCCWIEKWPEMLRSMNLDNL